MRTLVVCPEGWLSSRGWKGRGGARGSRRRGQVVWALGTAPGKDPGVLPGKRGSHRPLSRGRCRRARVSAEDTPWFCPRGHV